MGVDIILSYFPNLTKDQIAQYTELGALYKEWNEKINVISRKDIDNLYVHHILHSLAIAKFIEFTPESKILDLGTGGGFPGVPLAIFFPECNFLLVDSINKKLNVVNDIFEKLDLKNIKTKHARVEEIKGEKFDFIVTRAVAKIDQLVNWSRPLIASKHRNIYPNGIIALKGDLKEEIKLLSKREYKEIFNISKWFVEPYFQEKCLLYLQG